MGLQGWDRTEEMLLRDVSLLGGSRLLAPAGCSLLGDGSEESVVGGRTTHHRTQRHRVPGNNSGGKTTDRQAGPDDLRREARISRAARRAVLAARAAGPDTARTGARPGHAAHGLPPVP